MNLHLADAPVEIQYFGWALEDLPESRALYEFLVAPGFLPPDFSVAQVQAVYRRYLYPGPPSDRERLVIERPNIFVTEDRPRYVDIVPRNLDTLSSTPDELYDADRSLGDTLDGPAYRAMLAGFLGGLAGDMDAIEWLGLLLVRGSLNRQLTIGRYLGTLTQGQIGNREATLPTKREVLEWAQAIENRRFAYLVGDRAAGFANQLPRVISAYSDFIASFRDQL